MSLMHFFAQMGTFRVGPYLLAMPEEMDERDREDFTDYFKQMEAHPSQFESIFRGLNDLQQSQRVIEMAEAFMNERYPEPLYRVVASFKRDTFTTKEYYLPALKVLNYRDGEYWSPARTVKWKNNQLKAEHLEVEESDYDKKLYVVAKEKKKHDVGLQCDCGIYGSVNTEEIGIYLNLTGEHSMVMLDPTFEITERRLVIIEPSNNADVFVARKGWKASKAFISEIVGETISYADASELLSMVWQRKVDVYKAAMHKVILP